MDKHEQSFYFVQNPKKSEPNTANPTSLCDSVLLVDFSVRSVVIGSQPRMTCELRSDGVGEREIES